MGSERSDIYPGENVRRGAGNQVITGYIHCYLGGAIPSTLKRCTKHRGGIRWPVLLFPGVSNNLANTNPTI